MIYCTSDPMKARVVAWDDAYRKGGVFDQVKAEQPANDQCLIEWFGEAKNQIFGRIVIVHPDGQKSYLL